MNIIQFSDLKGYNVETVSGNFLGILHDIELDKDSFRVLNILISPAGLLKKIINANMIISVNDIIEILDSQKIIVNDSVVTETGLKVTSDELSGNTTSTQIANLDN